MLNKKYLRNTNYVLRKVHDSIFLIDITDNYSDGKCRIFELNEVGAFIWDNIEEPSSVKSVTEKLLSIIIDEVDPNDVYDDVKDCLDGFVNKGIAFGEN